MVRASLNYVNWQDRKNVVADLKPIYKATTADQAEQQLPDFEVKWPKYPAITRLWRDQWERVTPFFAFPEDVLKVVYTTNAVESLHMSLRKIIKARGSFNTEEAALKLLYLALTKVVAKWETVHHWKRMLNHLDTVCAVPDPGGRRPAVEAKPPPGPPAEYLLIHACATPRAPVGHRTVLVRKGPHRAPLSSARGSVRTALRGAAPAG